MNYYIFSILVGIVTTIIFYLERKGKKIYLTKKDCIKFFIFTSLISLFSIYGYLSLNKIHLNYKESIPILTGKPSF